MDKKYIIGFAVVFLVILIGGIVFVRGRSTDDGTQNETPAIVDDIPSIDSSVKVDLKARADNHAVTLTVENIPQDIESLEYELSYTTADGLPKGALAPSIKLKDGEHEKWTREVELGTCSRGVCKYDEGVTKISLTLIFNGESGKKQFKKDYTL